MAVGCISRPNGRRPLGAGRFATEHSPSVRWEYRLSQRRDGMAKTQLLGLVSQILEAVGASLLASKSHTANALYWSYVNPVAARVHLLRYKPGVDARFGGVF